MMFVRQIIKPQCDGCGSVAFETVTVGAYDKQYGRHRIWRVCADGVRMREACADRLNNVLNSSQTRAA